MGGWHSLATETTTEANLAVSELGLFYTLVPVEVADPVAQVVEEMTTWHTGQSLRGTERRPLFLLEPLIDCAPAENLGEVGKGQGIDGSCRSLSQGQRQQMCALRMEESPAF